MAFTKIAAAGIGSTGTITLENVVVTGGLNTPVITGAASTANVRANNLVVSGVSTLGSVVATTGTFSGNVSIAGTLTYEDVTNIDSIGLITARSGVVVNTGTATTALIVNGNARITGILTIGTSSVTLDGTNNQVNVGTGVTLHHTNGVQVGSNTLHSSGLTINSLNASGVITATSFSGDGSNLTNTGSTLSAASGSQRVVLTGQTSGTMTASATSASLSFNASTGALSATSFSGSGANLTGITSTSLANNSINKEQIRNSEITNSKLADESITASKFIGNSTTIDLNRKAIYLPRGFYVYGTDASVPAGTDLSGHPYGEGYNWDGYTTVSGYVISGSTVTARNFNNSPNGLLIIEMTRTPSSGGGPYGNINGGGHEIWSVNTAHHGWSGGSATLINAIGTLHGSYTTGSWYGIYITGGTGGTYYRVTFIH